MPEDSRPEPRWDIDWRRGRQAELWVWDIREAFANGFVEVKHDQRAEGTGNIFVEYKCFRRGKWRPSGIATTESDVCAFVIRTGEVMLVITTATVKELARAAVKRNPAARKEMMRGSHPTRGILVPIRDVLDVIHHRAA